MDAAGRTALVLAGGGAKGAFEAGAVAYLVEEAGLVPDVVTATSAGALCAVVLAQARGHEELVRRAHELRQDIRALTRNEVIMGKQPWVAALDGTPFGRAIDDWVVGRTRPPPPAGGPGAAPTAPIRRRRARAAAQVVRGLPGLARAARRIRAGRGSLLTLDPLGTLLRSGGDGVHGVDTRLVARPGVELRLAVVALGAGALRFVTQDGLIVEGDACTPVPGDAGGPVDLVDGVLASASVPLLFPPRPLAGDAYVDGGVIENVPVAAAANLGARRIYAVLAAPLAAPEDRRDYARASAPEILLRALAGISFAERQRASLAVTLPEGCELTVIDPVVDVVGPFELTAGLMEVSLDYGWMRAADLLCDLSPAARRGAADATDAVVVARSQAWHIEEQMWRAGVAPAAEVSALVRCKRVIRDALLERKDAGLPTPEGGEAWWSAYEGHQGARPSGLPDSVLQSG